MPVSSSRPPLMAGLSKWGLMAELMAPFKNPSANGQELARAAAVLRDGGHLNDHREFTMVMKAFKLRGMWDYALASLIEMLQRSLEPDAICYNAAGSACVLGERWDQALGILALMLREDLQPDVISYSSVISACAKCARWDWALSALAEMRVGGPEPDMICYSASVTACEKGGQWEWGLWLLSEMSRRGLQPNAITCSAAISACEKGRQWDRSMVLLSLMLQGSLEPNLISYKAGISACEKGLQWQGASAMLEQMQRRVLEPDVIAYSAFTSACEKCEQWQWAVLMVMEAHDCVFKPNAISYNAAISACKKGEQWERALCILADMRLRKSTPDVISYSAAISACEAGENWEWAIALVSEMYQRHLQPNVISYNAAISACESSKRWMQALAMLAEMSQRKLTPNVITFSAAISVCEKDDQWEQALGLLADAQRRELQPDVIMYNAAISACEKGCEWQRAVFLLAAMQGDGCSPNLVTYNSAILACSRHWQWICVLSLLDQMCALDVQPNVDSYGLLLMECEQEHLLDREVDLLLSWCRSLGQDATDFVLGAAAANAAALRLWQGGRMVEAQTVLLEAATHGKWSAVGEYLWGLCGNRASLIGAVRGPSLLAAPRALASRIVGNAAYGKELRLLLRVLELGAAGGGDAASVCEAMEAFGDEEWAARRSWSKVAGGPKAALLCAALRGAPGGGGALEIGTYCGYTAVRMARALPGVRLTTLEADPVHVVVARNVVLFAGLAQRLHVRTGHSRQLLERIAAQNRGASGYSAVFMDRWGSQYHEDFAALDKLGPGGSQPLLRAGSIVVADNVLWTGAALFLWHVFGGDAYRSLLSRVEELGTLSEDFMSISVRQAPPSPASPLDTAAVVPQELLRLHEEAEATRAGVLGRGTALTRDEFAAKMQREMLSALAHLGITPAADAPPDDATLTAGERGGRHVENEDQPLSP